MIAIALISSSFASFIRLVLNSSAVKVTSALIVLMMNITNKNILYFIYPSKKTASIFYVRQFLGYGLLIKPII
jgi:hypothetical protein